MSGKNGGARPGAGRPRKANKHAGAIADAEQRIADHLPEIVDTLIRAAKGTLAIEHDEEWIPSALATVKGPLRVPHVDDPEADLDRAGSPEYRDPRGRIWIDPKGKPLIVDLPIYPDKPPHEMVLVRRKPARKLPDAKAAAELLDRILGKAVPAADEPEQEAKDIPSDLMTVIDTYWGPPPEDPPPT